MRSPVLVLGLVGQVLTLDNGVGLTPPLGWSSWNHWAVRVNETILLNAADAFVATGLKDAGYQYINLDDGWSVGRNSSGYLIEDKVKFPHGLKYVVDYIHSRGLKFGIYTARGSKTCLGRPGSDSHEIEDAMLWASWGVDYLKEDSCGGTTHGTVWEQYARMRDALNATGRPIYFSVTQALPYNDAHPKMHCYGSSVFTVLPWIQQGLDPISLANSYLVEYCNNMDEFGFTAGVPHAGGFLSNLDSQQLLTLDNLTVQGAYNDNDMLQICNGGMTFTEDRAQFATWSILSSPLILGNDVSSMDEACKSIVLNSEVIAISQDPHVVRGTLVWQWPNNTWPNGTNTMSGPADPQIVATAAIAPCTPNNPAQSFSYDSTSGLVRLMNTSQCLTYGGYREDNFGLAECDGWFQPGIGGQLWNFSSDGHFYNVGNGDKCIDVFDCAINSTGGKPPPLQVCSCGGPVGSADCFKAHPSGCGGKNLVWSFDTSGQSAPIRSALDPNYCITTMPLPPAEINITLQAWSRHLSDKSVAVVLFNRGVFNATVKVEWSWLGAPSGTPFKVRDLHSHTDLGDALQSLEVDVGTHDSRALRFFPRP